METLPHELYEDARKRVRQKKMLFFHFVVFVLGSILMYVSNTFLAQDPNAFKWYPWVIAFWGFLLALHTVNVLIVDSFMNKRWEREQIDKLVEKQRIRIEALQLKVEEEYNQKQALLRKESTKIEEGGEGLDAQKTQEW